MGARCPDLVIPTHLMPFCANASPAALTLALLWWQREAARQRWGAVEMEPQWMESPGYGRSSSYSR